MPFAATWMDLEIISKDKYRITHLWNLKYDTNEPNLPNRNRRTVARGKGAEGGKEWEVGVSRCMEWINKVQLYDTENSVYDKPQWKGQGKKEYIHTDTNIYI